LKASKDISGYTGAARKVLDALKTHGLIVADNGSAWYISTTIDPNWGHEHHPDPEHGRERLRGRDVRRWLRQPDPAVERRRKRTPSSARKRGDAGPGNGGGGGGGGGCGLLGAELLLVWLAARSRPRK
jgi:hypothetical protein